MDSNELDNRYDLPHTIICSHCNRVLGVIRDADLLPLLCRKCNTEMENKLTELRRIK